MRWPARARWPLRIVFGLALLAALVAVVDLGEFVATLRKLDHRIFALLIVTALVSRLLRAARWNLLLRAGEVHISYWQAIRLSIVAHFAGSWTPGQLGGDAFRIVALRQFGKPHVVLSSLFLERYAALLVLSLLACLTLPVTLPYLMARDRWLVPFIVTLVLVIFLVLPLLWSSRLSRWVQQRLPGLPRSKLWRLLREFVRQIRDFRAHPRLLAAFFAVTFAETVTYIVMNYLSARSLGLEVSFLFFLCAMPIVHLLLRIPLSFQAVGIQEGCFAFALTLAGYDAAAGLAVSLVQRLLEWITSILPGAILSWLPGLTIKAR